jgi:hypothetical protein
MKIKEFILDVIISTELFEMAFNRKQAIDAIQYQSYEINLHLLKILMYGQVRDYEHWCSELNAWFFKIQRTRLKYNKQSMDFKTLYKILWEGYLESTQEVRDLITDIDNEYSKSYKLLNGDYLDIHKQIEDILYSVCYDISLSKFKDIRNYL